MLTDYRYTCDFFINVPSLPSGYHPMITIRAMARAASIITNVPRSATSPGRTKINKVTFINFHAMVFALC